MGAEPGTVMRVVVGRVSAGMFVALLVTGCAAGVPEPVVTPAVVWLDGEPSSELESDPWVIATREAEVAYAVAVNSANFSDPAMSARWSSDATTRRADQTAMDIGSGRAKARLGPMPFEPLVVVEADDGRSAEVVGCSGLDPLLFERDVGSPRTLRPRMLYRVVLGEDGERRVTGAGSPEGYVLPSGEVFEDETCDGVEVKEALFDPPPDLQRLIDMDPEDMVMPPTPSPTPR